MTEQEEIIEEVQEEAAPKEPEIPQEIINRAKMMGHIPKEEFRGDPEKWVPADKYAENLMPILRSQLGKYETEISSLKSTLEAQRKTTEKILKMSEKSQKIAYEQAKKDIMREQAQAVSDGDVEKWQKLEEKKESLPQPEVIVAEEPKNPIYDQWAAQNSWINEPDSDMAIFANSYGPIVQEKYPNISYPELLKKVEEKVKEVFPQKFSNPNRQNQTVVDTGAPTTPSKSKKTYNNLPADAKALCDQNVKDGLYKTKEEWVKVYYEEEE